MWGQCWENKVKGLAVLFLWEGSRWLYLDISLPFSKFYFQNTCIACTSENSKRKMMRGPQSLTLRFYQGKPVKWIWMAGKRLDEWMKGWVWGSDGICCRVEGHSTQREPRVQSVGAWAHHWVLRCSVGLGCVVGGGGASGGGASWVRRGHIRQRPVSISEQWAAGATWRRRSDRVRFKWVCAVATAHLPLPPPRHLEKQVRNGLCLQPDLRAVAQNNGPTQQRISLVPVGW